MHTIAHDGLQLDTGFIVFNERNYPRLVRLFSELGVRTQPSEMSFSVGCDRCSLEWSGRRPFAQPLNAASPRFLAFLVEVTAGCARRAALWRTGATATARCSTSSPSAATRGCSATTSSSRSPRRSGRRRPSARSSSPPATQSASSISTACSASDASTGGRWQEEAAHTLPRSANGWAAVSTSASASASCGARSTALSCAPTTEQERRFDKVVVAAHADQALRLLGGRERRGAARPRRFGYTTNDAVLHSDPSLLPRRRAARASWNFARGTAAFQTAARRSRTT